MKLKKHPLKKFAVQWDRRVYGNPEYATELKLESKSKVDRSRILRENVNNIALVQTDREFTYLGMIQKVDGNTLLIPLPDPTLVYYSNAYAYSTKLPELRKRLIEVLNPSDKLKEPAINEIYNFYGTSCGLIIFLFTAVESFINQQIPEKFIFSRELKNRTETYNKRQIQEHIDFKSKMTEVLPSLTGKDFFKKDSPSTQMIWNLKKFRDDIIHTKHSGDRIQYDVLLKKSLSFNYGKALEATASFMNFYKENYIEECPCSNNW